MAMMTIKPEQAIHLLHPGCTVMVTCIKDGAPNIITITWQSPVTSSPPTVIISVRKTRFSYDMIVDKGEYAINIPGVELAKEVHYCGTRSGRDKDKIKETGLTLTKGQLIETPLIKECIGHVECQLVDTHDVGTTHTLFIGKILGAFVEEKMFDKFWITGKGRAQLLHYLGGKKYAPLGERFDVEI